MNVTVESKNDVTGRLRYRTSLFGRLILQVQYRFPAESPGTFYTAWRDARVTDVQISSPSQILGDVLGAMGVD